MKASELRIGNYIQGSMIVHDGQIIENNHVSVNLNILKHLLESEGSPIGRVVGIPLTEDWLVKFGVDKEIRIKNNFYNIGLHPFYDDNYENEEYSFMFSINNENLKRIDHVHQLQNIYFALTGEELTINV